MAKTVKTQTTENTATQGQGKDTTRPMKTGKQRVHDMEEAAKNVAGKAGTGIKKGVCLVGRGAREGMIDIASLGMSAIVGSAVNTAANNLFINGVAAANSGFNTLTGRGTVNVKTRFGGWKTMSLADYTSAVNRGVKFKDAEANFFVNRHAKEFNAAAKVVGGIAGGTAGAGTFVTSRSMMKGAFATKGDLERNRQACAELVDDCMSDFFEDEEE